MIAADAQGNDPIPQNIPGSNGAVPDPKATSIEPWLVVHLHGGKTEPNSDGWTEDVLLSGQSRIHISQ